MKELTVGTYLNEKQFPDIRSLNGAKPANLNKEDPDSFSDKVNGEASKVRQLLAGLMKNISGASTLSGGDSGQALTDFARISVDLLGMERDIKNQETQTKISGALEKQIASQEANLAAQMIGRKTEAEVSTLTLDQAREKPKVTYDMPAKMATASVVIRNVQDQIVYVEPLTDLSPGQQRPFAWQGQQYQLEAGEWRLKDAPSGTYKISILGETQDGKATRLPVFSKETISWIKLPTEDSPRTALGVGGRELTLDQLRTLSDNS